MRISDWRSDVCSSDLDGGLLRRPGDGRRDVVAQVEQQGDVLGAALAVEHAAQDLLQPAGALAARRALPARLPGEEAHHAPRARQSVVSGKSVSVRVDLGGRRIIKKKKYSQHRL